jgi:branched-subunit amino acid transport protein
MTPWLVIVTVGIASYLLRISMLVLAARVGVPFALERAARFAVPTAFSALAATALATRATGDGPALAPFAAMAVAVLAVSRTGSPQAALLTGMPTLWVLSALSG